MAVEIICEDDIYGAVDDKPAKFSSAGSQAVWIINALRGTIAPPLPTTRPVVEKLPLWTSADRAQWNADMMRNYRRFIEINLDFKDADF